MRSSLFFLVTVNAIETCKIVDRSAGIIKSSEFESTQCPAWYQVWRGEVDCYPAKEFKWCWSLRPSECDQLQVKFNKFAVEEQSKALHNYHNLSGEDVCIDRVELVTDFGYYLFCDESHQISREATYMENMAFDPFLNGWFDWTTLNVTSIDILFESTELGGAGSSNFAGFELEWRCSGDLATASEKKNDSFELGDLNLSNMIVGRSLDLGMDKDVCESCDPNASCFNGKCVCNDGFVGSGFACIALQGKCHQRHQQQCDSNAVCLEILGVDGFECKCKDGYKGDGFSCKQWLFGIAKKPKSDADASNVWMDIHENSIERTSGGFSFIDDVDTNKEGAQGRMAECNEKCGDNASCLADKCVCNNGFVGNGMFCIPAGFGDMTVGNVTTEAVNVQTDEPDVRGGGDEGVGCIMSPVVEGECSSTLTAAFDHIFCLDKFRSKGKREKLMEEAFTFEQLTCALIDKKREKKTCIDRGVPRFSLAQSFSEINDFASFLSSMEEFIRRRFRYCRKHGHYSRQFDKFVRSYERAVKQ